jgi:hypothetical protein
LKARFTGVLGAAANGTKIKEEKNVVLVLEDFLEDENDNGIDGLGEENRFYRGIEGRDEDGSNGNDSDSDKNEDESDEDD